MLELCKPYRLLIYCRKCFYTCWGTEKKFAAQTPPGIGWLKWTAIEADYQVDTIW